MEHGARTSTKQDFHDLVAAVACRIRGRALDGALQDWLNQHYGAHTAHYAALRQACATGVDQAWLCERENGGIRWGRVFEASEALGGCSVDVVQMQDLAGPHHRHPLGEIDLVLPLDDDARFDGHGAGWCVYGPDSSHHPTVTGGAAQVLYLLPQGQIEFTRRARA
ncbi:MAG: DUF4863 family protein [Burkholderiaceae bacterium]|jgi:hypothetical protein|nr:DUF4863 family protein [Burkholderiaceae bacterium]